MSAPASAGQVSPFRKIIIIIISCHQDILFGREVMNLTLTLRFMGYVSNDAVPYSQAVLMLVLSLITWDV